MKLANLDNFEREQVLNWASEDHKVVEVIVGSSGKVLRFTDSLTGTRAEVFGRRSRAKETIHSDSPAYRCSYCHRPVFIASTKDRAHFFFRHRQGEGFDCPYENKAQLTHAEILARQYNCTKESSLHRRMKEILRQSLVADPLVQEVFVEKTVIGSSPGTRRKPDVRAILKDGRNLVFEVQLSSTFLDVMKARLASGV